MKFVVFGATGPTGQILVEECLKQSHEVVALVRNPDKLQIKHENLAIHKVNIFKKDETVPLMKGSNAVFSCLGTQAVLWQSCTVYSESVKAITEAMREAGVSRFTGISSRGTKYEPGLPWVVKWFLRPIFLRNVIPDIELMEDYLTESCQDLDFTIVRPPQLTYARSSDKEVVAVEGQYVPNASLRIPRHDVAKFMLKCVVNGEWKKKHVSVGIK